MAAPGNGRRAPDTRFDAMYDRIIEVQQKQAAIAESQAAMGARRDQILDRVSETLAKLGNLAEIISSLTKTNADEIGQLAQVMGNHDNNSKEGREILRDALNHTKEAAIAEIKEDGQRRDKEQRWWLFAAALIGTALGSGTLAPWLEGLLKFHP